MSTKMDLLFASIFLILCTVLLTSPAMSAELTPVKMGMSYDFSGPNAEAGKMEYDTAMLAVEETNAKGGINGRKIVTIPLDDASNPARAVSNAKRLIELENVKVIVGSSTRSSSLGLMKVAEPAKIPVFGNLTASSACYVYRYYFSQPIDRANIEAIMSRISVDGHKRLAHLYINIAWGVGNIQLVKDFGSRLGLQVVSQEALDPSATDHSILLTKVRGTKPDAVFPTTLGASAAVLARGFESIGWRPPLYYTELFPKIASKS